MKVVCIRFLDSAVDKERVAEACLNVSPQISISSRGALFIEIGKCQKILTAGEMVEKITELLIQLDVKATLSVGSDVAQALALSFYPTPSPTIYSLPLAAVRELSFPYGSDEDTEKNLQHMLESLKNLGLKTVEQFVMLPARQFPSRFGQLGLFCHQRVKHGAGELWQNWNPKPKIIEALQIDYGQTCDTLEPLMFLAKQLLDRMFLRMHGLGLALNTLYLQLEFEKLSTVKHRLREWRINFMLSQNSTKSVLPILMERWQKDFSRTPLEAEIVNIKFEATDTSRTFDGQKSFFQMNDDGERMHALLAHMAECLGQKKVFQASLTQDRFPEKSWRRLKEWKHTDGLTPQEIARACPDRPLRLLSDPLRLQITAGKLFLNGRGFTTTTWSCVERISGHWLDKLETRNYYKVNIQEGPPLWIFQDPQDQFYLHGYYE